MPSPKQLIVGLITPEDQLYVDRFRRFLNDSAELNVLDQVQESSDMELFEALQDCMEEFNFEFEPVTNYTKISQFPSWSTLRTGATLNILTTKGILSARNTLTFNDAGGITVQDYDRYGRYVNYYNILYNKYYQGIQRIKLKLNLDMCWGGVPSEFAIKSDYDESW